MATRNDRSDDVTDGLNDREKIGSEGQVYTPKHQDGTVNRQELDEAESVRENTPARQADDTQGSYIDRSSKKI